MNDPIRDIAPPREALIGYVCCREMQTKRKKEGVDTTHQERLVVRRLIGRNADCRVTGKGRAVGVCDADP